MLFIFFLEKQTKFWGNKHLRIDGNKEQEAPLHGHTTNNIRQQRKEIAENSNMTQWPFFKGGKRREKVK
jgi:hypothetical protein